MTIKEFGALLRGGWKRGAVLLLLLTGWPLLALAGEHGYSGWWLPPNVGGDVSLILDRAF